MQERDRVDIYVGPSATEQEIRAVFKGSLTRVRLLPPIQQGDLIRSRSEWPTVVAIIDGYFHHVPAVLHKEILVALEAGVRVLGAASMGALRAAELDSFGMEGVGEVYRMYQSGEIDSDDEVAVLHAGPEHGYRTMSEPLVNVRHNLRRARDLGTLTSRSAATLLASARRLHYTQRTYEAMSRSARLRLNGWQEFLETRAVDLKRTDALALVRLVADRLCGKQSWPPRVPVRFQSTKYFRILEREYAGFPLGDRHVPERTVLALHQLLSPTFPILYERVANRCLAVDEARHRGIESMDADGLLRRFCRSRRLTGGSRYRVWLNRHYLSESELIEALRDRFLEARLLESYRSKCPIECIQADVSARLGIRACDLKGPMFMRPGILWEGPILRELKLSGAFVRAMELAGCMLAFEANLFAGNLGLREAFDALAPEACNRIEAWVIRRWRITRKDLEAELRQRGFARYQEFLEVARLAYAFEQRAHAPTRGRGTRRK